MIIALHDAGQARCDVCFQHGVAGEDVFKCQMGTCGLYYHRRCLANVVGSGPMLQAAVLPPGRPVELERDRVRCVCMPKSCMDGTL
jgi:hypothetical protein